MEEVKMVMEMEMKMEIKAVWLEMATDMEMEEVKMATEMRMGVYYHPRLATNHELSP